MADLAVASTFKGAGIPFSRGEYIEGCDIVVADSTARLAIVNTVLRYKVRVRQSSDGAIYEFNAADHSANTSLNWSLVSTGGSSGTVHTAVVTVCTAAVTESAGIPTGTPTQNGVTLANGNRVLLTAQATAANNRFWTVGAPWVVAESVAVGDFVSVTGGTLAGSIWTNTSTSPLTWSQNATGAGGVSLGTATPKALGTAAVGVAIAASHEDHVHADLTRIVADYAALTALDASVLPDRHTVWVTCCEDEFYYDAGNSGLTATTATILATSVGGTTRWIRKRKANLKWQSRTAWFIDYSGSPVGDDKYDGSTTTISGYAGPLLTRSEMIRRIGREGNFLINQAVTVTVAGTRQTTDPLEGFIINLGPSGTWTETGVAAEAFTLTGPGLFYLTGRAGVVQLGPTATSINSAAGRSMLLSFEVAFDTTDATLTTIWTFTPPANSSCTVNAIIEEKKAGTAEAEAVTVIDSYVRDGTSNVARKGSASQENYAARTSALSAAVYTLAPATTTVAMTVTNVAATIVRGTAYITVVVNPD